jgi:glycosyltransferase involved in cell wall biosynthesis
VRKTRFVWVYNWVDNTFFRPLPNRDEIRRKWDLPPDRFVFLYAGRFDWSKQVDRIIAALRANRYDATFLFAGDGTLGPELEALAPFNDVRVLGTRAADELVELHNAADVLLWGSVDVDYPGLVVMEAMASGLPVATANTSMNPLYPDVAVDAGILGGPGLTRHYPASPQGIDAAIRDSLARRNELAALRPAARRFAVERFGESNAQTFLDLLTSLKRT